MKPLKGLTVLDCSVLLPGPFVGKLMLREGARVIKIESPRHPDRAKMIGAAYKALNAGKEIVSLDLSNPSDRPRFDVLAREAHGLIEAFRPTTKVKLGLDEKSLHRVNPKLCIASLVGYPETSPLRDRAGHDMNFMARSGALSLFNEQPGLPLGDLFSAYDLALRLAGSMLHAQKAGQGSRIVTSIYETLLSVQDTLVVGYLENGIAPSYGKTLHTGSHPCYRIYRAADGKKIMVAAIEEKFWSKFCSVLGLSHLKGEGLVIGSRAEIVSGEIQNVLGSKSWLEWEPLFATADCCVEPVLEYPEVFGRAHDGV